MEAIAVQSLSIPKLGFEVRIPANAHHCHWWSTVFPDWRNVMFQRMSRFLHPKKTMLDIGSDLGAVSLFAAPLSRRVISIDADEQLLKCQKSTNEFNHLLNVDCIPLAVGNATTKAKFGSCVVDDTVSIEQMTSVKFGSAVVGADGASGHTELQYCTPIALRRQKYTNADSATMVDILQRYVHGDTLSFVNVDICGFEWSLLRILLTLAMPIGDGGQEVPLFIHFYSTYRPVDLGDDLTAHCQGKLWFVDINGTILNAAQGIQLMLHAKEPYFGLLALNKRQLEVYKLIPVYIIGYNNLTYVRHMVDQLSAFTTDITVIDNKSTYPALLNYYEHDYAFKLWKQHSNHGHRVAYRFDAAFPDAYVITDPDLELHPDTPKDFIQQLLTIAKRISRRKIGLALAVHDRAQFIHVPGGYTGCPTIYDWERRFWVNRFPDPDYELYEADVDTTFALHYRHGAGHHPMRIAGNFTCRHLPWYGHSWTSQPEEERWHYKNANISSSLKWQW